MQSVGEQLGIGNLENFRPHPALVSADAVGVELELEGFTARSIEEAQRHLHPLWTTTSDGSLRNGGVELITNGGLGGEQLHAAFERVHALLERINYDASWRCSTHMHINMRDFTVNQVVRFMLVYAACEPVLFAHCGKFRYSSNFCVPIADSLPFHKKLISRLYDNVVKTRNAAQATVKYTAMNFQPLFGDGRNRPALGTVEFRGGRPMTTTSEFVLQANLLLSIKQFVRESTDKEADMLTRLNEGVMNTVYANGCAAELTPDPAELDEALVHAWMLLKAYQKGMKVPQKASRDETLWQALDSPRRSSPAGEQVANRLTPSQIQALGYWCAGDILGTTRAEPINATSASHPRYQRLVERQLNTVVPGADVWNAEYTMVEMAQILRSEFRFSEDVACHTAAIWYLNQLTNARLALPQARASQVICMLHHESQRGRVSWLHRGRGAGQQPRFTWGSARFGYYDLGEPRLRMVCDLSGENVARGIFDWILHADVRIKRVADLQTALQERGFEGVTFNPRANGCTYAQAGLMMYLLKATGLSSADHIHAASLNLYDRVAAVIDIMHASSLSVPIFKHYSHGGRGLIRCEHTLTTPMGHNIPREVFQTLPQRQPRTSEATGLPVY
jgi:Putative amidoligase enzyme.